MEPLPQYEVVVNNQLMGIIAASAVILTVLVFLMLYYIFIEKTGLVRYAGYYFCAALLGLILTAIQLSTELGQVYSVPCPIIAHASLLTEYLSIHFTYLFVLYTLRKVNYKVYLIAFSSTLMVAMALLGSASDRPSHFLILYAFVIAGLISISALKHNQPFAIAIGLTFVIIVLGSQYSSVLGLQLASLQWVVDIIFSSVLTLIFIRRYKGIKKEKDQFFQRLTRDHMTGAWSKSYFLKELETVRRGGILFMDIDKFKWINDNFGHHEGDRLLKEFAGFSMSFEGLVFARYGGDEFVGLIKDQNEERLQEIAESMNRGFVRLIRAYEGAVEAGVGISFGIAMFGFGRGLEAIEGADTNMYAAKGNGGSREIRINRKLVGR